MAELSEAWVLEAVGGPALVPPMLQLRAGQVLGRGPENDWILADALVSRRHLQIEARADRWYVRDLGSRAGTLLNEHPLPAELATPIQLHDRLRIGPYRLRVRPAGSGAPTRNFRSATTGGGATQVAMPILAAEQRLELLVEYAAQAAQVKTSEALQRLTLNMVKRALNADVVLLVDAQDGDLLMVEPAGVAQELDLAALQAAEQGGVVPSRHHNGRQALSVAWRVDGACEAFVQAWFMHLDVRGKSELPELLHALVRLAGLSAGNLSRREAEVRVQRLQADLESAREVQERVLPPRAGHTSVLRYALHLHPGRLVAGDLVDVLTLDSRRCVVMLGDVAGAGVGAGFLMAGTLAHMRALLERDGDIEAAVGSCNRFLARVGGGRFVTLWLAMFDRHNMQISVIDAGHGHARRVLPGGTIEPLTLRGSLPMGVDPDAQFVAEPVALSAGQRLVVYSDGVAEQRNAAGESFGASAIDAILRRSPGVEQDVKTLFAGLELHAGGQLPADDATLLSLGWSD